MRPQNFDYTGLAGVIVVWSPIHQVWMIVDGRGDQHPYVRIMVSTLEAVRAALDELREALHA